MNPDSLQDLTQSFVTTKTLESLLPTACRVEKVLNLERGGLVAHVKISAFESYKVRLNKAREHLWSNLGVISSDTICHQHGDYVEKLADELGVDCATQKSSWLSVGFNLARVVCRGLSVLASLPLVDPVEKTNIKRVIYHHLSDHYTNEIEGLDWLYKQTGRGFAKRRVELSSIVSTVSSKLEKPCQRRSSS